MVVFLYTVAFFSMIFAMVSLTGRTTSNLYGIGRGYFRGDKLDKDDPARTAHIAVQFFTWVLTAAASLLMGLHLDKWLVLSRSALLQLSLRYVLAMVLMSLVYVFLLRKSKAMGRACKNQKPSLQVGGVAIYYGVSTPQVFDETRYRVAYEAFVQEGEIPFATCELRTAAGNEYVGDIIFKKGRGACEKREIRFWTIEQIHLQ